MVEMVSDLFHEGIFLELIWEKSFKVVRVLSNEEISKSDIAQEEVLLAQVCLQIVEFALNFLQNSPFSSIIFLIPDKSTHFLEGITDNSDQSVHFSSIHQSLAQKVLVS